MKKLISLALAGAMTAAVAASGAVPASASGGEVGNYGFLPEYQPALGVTTQHLMFAMPGAWQNGITRDERCGGAAGAYWWSGYDTPDNAAGSNGWPGYKTSRVEEEGIGNLWSVDVPAYGNGESGDVYRLIWNNYLDGGTETDIDENPFYGIANQTKDVQCQYYSRYDDNETYEKLFRYCYKKIFTDVGVYGAEDLDLYSDSFWVNANMLAAEHMGENWDRLNNDEKTYQADVLLDDIDFTFSEFGDYAGNFFNEDRADEIYPKEDPCGYCLSFTFDNMVYVVDLDPMNMVESPVIGKPCYSGEWYFYYGGGAYGSWPTEELNDEMGGVSGNFDFEEYKYSDPYYWFDPTSPTEPYDPFGPTVPGEPGQISSGTFYFDVSSTNWRNYKKIYCYLYDHTTGEELIVWGSKKGTMTDEGDGLWSFDMEQNGYSFDSNHAYGVIFSADWGIQTCDLIIGPENYGDTAYCTGGMVENSVDSNKRSNDVRWRSGAHGTPIEITSIGNVIGEEYWKGESSYTLLLKFLTSTNSFGLENALRYNGKTEKQTIQDAGYALGLSDDEIGLIVQEAERITGRDYDWGEYHNHPATADEAGSFEFTVLDDGTCMVTDYFGAREYVEIPETYKVWSYGGSRGKTYSSVGGYDDDDYGYEAPETVPYPTEPSSGTSSGSTSSSSGGYYDYTVTEYVVTAIGDWVFANNKYMKGVTIPGTVTSIGKGAFYNCVRLESVEIPDSVTLLGSNAFEKCLYLESVTLGAGLDEIEDETFYDCRRLTDINIPENVTYIGEEAFYNCRSLKKLALPNGVRSIGGKGGVSSVGVFEECRSLESLIIPDSVTEIGENAFENCKRLTLRGTKGSYAETYAAENGAEFENVGNVTKHGTVIGDIDGNGRPDISDATLVQMQLCEYLNADGGEIVDTDDPIVMEYADADGDGRLTIRDVTKIQRFTANMIDTFR